MPLSGRTRCMMRRRPQNVCQGEGGQRGDRGQRTLYGEAALSLSVMTSTLSPHPIVSARFAAPCVQLACRSFVSAGGHKCLQGDGVLQIIYRRGTCSYQIVVMSWLREVLSMMGRVAAPLIPNPEVPCSLLMTHCGLFLFVVAKVSYPGSGGASVSA